MTVGDELIAASFVSVFRGSTRWLNTWRKMDDWKVLPPQIQDSAEATGYGWELKED
jgi:hypothetical protein